MSLGGLGFAGAETPPTWPVLPGTPQPERLELSIDVLPGVGPAVKKRLAKLGLGRSATLSVPAAPVRAAAPERRITELFGEDEAVIAGEVRQRAARSAAAAG